MRVKFAQTGPTDKEIKAYWQGVRQGLFMSMDRNSRHPEDQANKRYDDCLKLVKEAEAYDLYQANQPVVHVCASITRCDNCQRELKNHAQVLCRRCRHAAEGAEQIEKFEKLAYEGMPLAGKLP